MSRPTQPRSKPTKPDGNPCAAHVAKVDELLQRVFLIAEDLAEIDDDTRAARARARRAGKRIMKLVDELDDVLGLG